MVRLSLGLIELNKRKRMTHFVYTLSVLTGHTFSWNINEKKLQNQGLSMYFAIINHSTNGGGEEVQDFYIKWYDKFQKEAAIIKDQRMTKLMVL